MGKYWQKADFRPLRDGIHLVKSLLSRQTRGEFPKRPNRELNRPIRDPTPCNREAPGKAHTRGDDGPAIRVGVRQTGGGCFHGGHAAQANESGSHHNSATFLTQIGNGPRISSAPGADRADPLQARIGGKGT